jgi:large subunit ribosomal protein L21
VTYAVIGTGGKQYRVSEGAVLDIERLQGEAGDAVTFDQVLLVGGEAGVTVGTPQIDGAAVQATIVEHCRGTKVLVFKKKRRKQYKRTRGHRQELTKVRITKIETGS